MVVLEVTQVMIPYEETREILWKSFSKVCLALVFASKKRRLDSKFQQIYANFRNLILQIKLNFTKFLNLGN